jgi:hypothetical protein
MNRLEFIVLARIIFLVVFYCASLASGATGQIPVLRLDSTLVSALPLDSAAELNRFLPGYFRGWSAGGLRGNRLGFATYLDGIPVHGQGLVRPALTALDGVELHVSQLPKRFSPGSGGVVDYRSLSGSAQLAGSAAIETDRFAPIGWQAAQNRVRLRISGPVPGTSQLRFFVVGDGLGNRYLAMAANAESPLLVASGPDQVLAIPRTGQVPGGVDSARVTLPRFTPWEGNTSPLGNSDRLSFSTGLNLDLPNSGTASLRVHGQRSQQMSRALTDLYNPDAWRGQSASGVVTTISAAMPLGSFQLRARGSHQRFEDRTGVLDPEWANSNGNPTSGFARSLAFLGHAEDFPVTPVFLPGASPLDAGADGILAEDVAVRRHGVPGLSQPLRFNPYAMRSQWFTNGIGSYDDNGLRWRSDRVWYGDVELSKKVDRHDLSGGAQVTASSMRGRAVTLAPSYRPSGVIADPMLAAVWAQDEFRFGALTADVGARFDRLDPGADNTLLGAPLESRSAVSAHARAGYAINDRIDVRASVERAGEVMAPIALYDLFSLDLGSPAFRNDVEIPVSTIAEASAGIEIAPHLRFDVTGYHGRFRNELGGGRISNENNILNTLVNMTSMRKQSGGEAVMRASSGMFDVLASYSVMKPHVDDALRTKVSYQSASAIVGVRFIGGESPGGPVLNDMTLHIAGSYDNGLPYTPMINEGYGTLAPGVTGILAGNFQSARVPGGRTLDLRLTKGFAVAGSVARLVLDFRNPLGLEMTRTVYAETGTVDNDLYRESQIEMLLLNYLARGTVQDEVIDALTEVTANRFALHRAEQRFGNGDGIFSVAEQRAVVTSYYELTQGMQWRRAALRTMRIGIEIGF